MLVPIPPAFFYLLMQLSVPISRRIRNFCAAPRLRGTSPKAQEHWCVAIPPAHSLQRGLHALLCSEIALAYGLMYPHLGGAVLTSGICPGPDPLDPGPGRS